MSHMVIYRGADGKPGYHQTDDIHDAVGFVEQMRNDEGVEHARIFRLEEVVFEYRPYYRVELSTAGAPMMLGASAAPQLPEPEAVGAIAMPAPSPDAAAAPMGLNGTSVNGANGANGAAATGDGTTTGPVNGSMPDSIDLVDESIDIVDHVDEGQPKVDAGSGKKGLFGR